MGELRPSVMMKYFDFSNYWLDSRRHTDTDTSSDTSEIPICSQSSERDDFSKDTS